MNEQHSQLKLTDPVERVPGVDRHSARLLARLGILRASDLLFFFPRTYQQAAPRVTLDQFTEGLRVSCTGTIVDIDERVTQSGKHIFGMQLEPDGGGCIRLLWFNQPFRRKMHQRGDRLMATGILRSTGLNWEMVQPQTTPADTQPADVDKPIPIYSLTEGLKQTTLRQLMRRAIPPLVDLVEEAMPEQVRERLGVVGIHQALRDIHFPSTQEDADQALRRFKLQELFVLQLALSMQRIQRERSAPAPICDCSGRIHARILARLGYQLTVDQESAIQDIRSDMGHSVPMNRLLQGDVGSGKTLVAQYAMLLCVANEHQAALMAPTEVLARQHADSLERSLAHSRVRVGLLTGSLGRRERSDLLQRISAGEVDLVVGTQALLSEEVLFHRLGLVIVDEQHKFGVLQRARMRRDGVQPHYLILSATPIPRTIAMSSFGDLDVSVIRTKPPGRAKVHTYLATPEQLPSWWRFVDQQIAKGKQAYVIAPRVLESTGDETLASAEGVYSELREGPFQHRRLGLLHGKQSSEVKEQVLGEFQSSSLDLLVSTTVVEVGIDVPNATVITILDADRLGLSQLHQLRGRINRGTSTGYACAVASAGCNATDNQRLKAFAESDDGFQLAELDLRMRGPGDLLGTSQTGMPPLRVADLLRDSQLLDQARELTNEILLQDPNLQDPQLGRLLQQTLRRYGKTLQLGDVG